MGTSRNAAQLLHAWIGWRTAVGGQQIQPYWQHVKLSNHGARLNGFENAGALWRSPYEMTAPALAKGPQLNLVVSFF